jgi:hypothetical protein
MTSEEWPIAAPSGEAAAPAHAAGRDRLRTVRVDFFLPPNERLSEQERALMTAMLHCLVEEVAASLRASLPSRSTGANDDEAELVDKLTSAGLLNDANLIALLLQRAEEERIGSAARGRSGRREARALQGLVSHDSSEVSAAAMGLILARGRRRNRFGQCLLSFDDLPRTAAERLANAVAAALRSEHSTIEEADARLSAAATELTSRHDPLKGVEALTEALVRRLADADALNDELLLACAQEGEVALIAAAAAVRAGIAADVAIDELLSGNGWRIARLMRVADFSRGLSAGILASLGDLLAVEDPGEAINQFDAFNEAQLASARRWLAASPSYREALDALDGRHG